MDGSASGWRSVGGLVKPFQGGVVQQLLVSLSLILAVKCSSVPCIWEASLYIVCAVSQFSGRSAVCMRVLDHEGCQTGVDQDPIQAQ